MDIAHIPIDIYKKLEMTAMAEGIPIDVLFNRIVHEASVAHEGAGIAPDSPPKLDSQTPGKTGANSQ